MDSKMEKGIQAIERDILGKMVGGLSEREIAFALELTDADLNTIFASICKKLDVSDRESACKAARERKIVVIDV